jgi:hypothetical protein
VQTDSARPLDRVVADYLIAYPDETHKNHLHGAWMALRFERVSPSATLGEYIVTWQTWPQPMIYSVDVLAQTCECSGFTPEGRNACAHVFAARIYAEVQSPRLDAAPMRDGPRRCRKRDRRRSERLGLCRVHLDELVATLA